MRVTSNTLPDALKSQLNTLLSRQAQLQSQATSGQRVQNLDDDPATAAQVLDLQAQARSVAQYRLNVATHQDLTTAAYVAIKGLKSVSDRANEIAVLADGLKSPDEIAAYGKEVTQLIEQAAQLGN